MEAVRGKVGLASVKFTGKFVVFRFYKERKELRDMVRLEKEVKQLLTRLHSKKHDGDVKNFVKVEEDGLQKILILMGLFLNLSKNLAFDMGDIKKIIKEIHNLDIAVLHERFPKETAEKLDAEVIQDLRKTNSVLRTVSDIYGALSSE